VGSLFSIDDDEEEATPSIVEHDRHAPGKGGGADLDLATAVVGHTKDGYVAVKVDLLEAQANVLHSFRCSELSEEGYMIPSFLVMTRTHILKLRVRVNDPDHAFVLWRRDLLRLMKITSKKKHPDLLVMQFECEPGETPATPASDAHVAAAGSDGAGDVLSISERFLVPQYVEAKAALATLVSDGRDRAEHAQ
jgi:hypothetical protein